MTVKSKAYTGKTLKPTSVTVKVGGKKLVSGRDYTVSCKGGKAVGSYKVTVKGKGAYTGTKTAAFKILPKATSVSKTKAAKRGFTVAWKKPSKANLKQTTGYKVQWSTDKKFKKAVKSKLVKKSKTTSLKVSKLKGGKKYYVRVCAYKKVGSAYYYSAWSKAKAVKTKK
ncbi:fibronectin type III domain-containing protein [Adlercreutzia caecimuris]|uniref:fibronectin type III domain-containing protein n=1 Tax=Adlercreutzia caecimuris TaxID=671266 RepID=UPI00272B5FC8|nr:fibronectin type III domain-containing protein [Adlercreutzia caecimuris]